MACARVSLRTAPAATPARASAVMGAAPLRMAAPSAGNACRTVVTMAKKGKDVRLMITLECTEQKASGVGGMSRYTSEKARARQPATSGGGARVRACRGPPRAARRDAPAARLRTPAGATGAAAALARCGSEPPSESWRALWPRRCTRLVARFLTRTHAPQNRRNTPGRIELMKYNRYLRRMTLHREVKK